MEIVDELANGYAEKFTSGEEQLLQEIAEFTRQTHPKAHMLSGHVQGKFLEMLSFLIRPKSILEVGTFTGYSAICLASGLQPGGELHTIESSATEADTAERYFSNSLYNNKIFLYRGNAIDIIPTIDREWDMVFLDADKVSYINYYELTLPKVKRGGLLIADNVLFHGRVLENEIRDKSAKAIDLFNRHVAADERVQQVVLTVRDGISLIRKL